MSTLHATITEIQKEDILHLVSFMVGEISLKMISLELDPKAQVGTEVRLSVKASSVAIAKDFQGELSYSNQIPLTIDSIEEGQILTNLKLSNDSLHLESLITTASTQKMQLKEGERVTALVKSSDLFISEVL